jgi:hypothetical protein
VVPAASDVMSLTIYSLNKDALYEFAIMSRSPHGVALFSDTVTTRTKGKPKKTLIIVLEKTETIQLLRDSFQFSQKKSIGIQIVCAWD